MNIIDLWKYPIEEVDEALKDIKKKGRTIIEKYIILTEYFAKKQLLTRGMNKYVLSKNFRVELISNQINSDEERINLIENFMKKRVTIIKELTGINMFVYYKNLNLLLLGESHDFEGIYDNIYYIVDYLIDLLSVKDINLYIEDPIELFNSTLVNKWYKNVELNEKDPLEFLKSINFFQSPMSEICYYLKKKKYYPIDARENIYGMDMLGIICTILPDILENIDDFSSFDNGEIYGNENILDLFLYILGFGEEYKDIYDKYISLIIFHKDQMEEFSKKSLQDDISLLKEENIIKFREYYLNLIRNELNDNIDKKRFINSLYKSFLYKIEEDKKNGNYSSLVQELEAVKMDVYCLLKFLNRDDKKTSIIYTGSDHIRTYKKFIEYYFNEYPTISKYNENIKYISFDRPFVKIE